MTNNTATAGGSRVGKFGIGVRVVDDEGDVGVIVGKRKGERQVDYDRYGELWWPKGLLAVAANDNAGQAGELKLEAGKFYRTRDGRKVGPMVVSRQSWTDREGNTSEFDNEIGEQYAANGNYLSRSGDCSDDLIAEWSDAPLEEAPSISPEIVVNDYSGAAEGENSSEWVPKVGDRVRFKDRFVSGDGAIVAEAQESSFDWTVKPDTDAGGYFYKDGRFGYRTRLFATASLEPLPVAEQPAADERVDERADAGGGFKAGDRIRLIDGELPLMPIGSEFVAVARTRGPEISVHFTGGSGDETWRPGSYFELVTPFTIEAGKSYRTRDGRKADVLRDQGGWLAGDIVGGEQGKAWNRDGSHGGPYVNRIPSHDLVAEWVEPAAEVAVVEATATTKWEPAIGDKVRVAKPGVDFKEKHLGVEFVITNEDSEWDGERSWYSSRGERAGGWRYKTSELAPVTDPAPPASFKVGDRVREIKHPQSEGVVTGVMGSSFSIEWDEGHKGQWLQDNFELAPLTTPTFARNDLVTLAAPVKVTGTSGDRVHISFPNGGSFTLPSSALIAA